MTKTNSPNYSASGTQFPIADNANDPLAKEDLFTLQKAVNEHTHDDTRGLAVRRINTSSAPSAVGQVRINGDSFQWWANTSGLVLAAASLGADQVWTGDNRFNEPLILPDQGGTPAAPGAGLNVLYGKNGQLFKRSGAAGVETPVGAPPGVMVVAKMFETPGTAGWAEFRSITLAGGAHMDSVLTFDGAADERADFSFPVPPSYVGTPINFIITWRTTATSGNAAFKVTGLLSGTGGDLTAAQADLAAQATFAAQGTASRKNLSVLPWTASLPSANDWLQASFFRMGAQAADTINAVDVDVLSVVVSFG